jgi:hypothetical protein
MGTEKIYYSAIKLTHYEPLYNKIVGIGKLHYSTYLVTTILYEEIPYNKD